jgi:hypothetical protein
MKRYIITKHCDSINMEGITDKKFVQKISSKPDGLCYGCYQSGCQKTILKDVMKITKTSTKK